MFLDNKYTKWYFNIIRKYSFEETPIGLYTEIHHIIPRSLGGNDIKENLTIVSARVHFILHLLLLKMCKFPRDKRSMSFAFIMMSRSNSKQRYLQMNSKLFERYKRIASIQFKGENNPMYGKGHLFKGKNNPMYGKPCYYNMSEEQKQQWKKNISKGIKGEKNPFYNKKHSEKTRRHISECRSKYITVIFDDGNIEHFRGYKELGLFLGKSGSLGATLCNEQFKHRWKKYNIKDIEKYENKEDQISRYGDSIRYYGGK